MNISLEILKEKFLPEENKENKENKENNFFDFKKTGIFTGLRTSMTVHKNHDKNQIKHFLGNKAIKKINENIEFIDVFENSNQNSSVVYRRNVVNLNGAKRSAVPHGIIEKVAQSKKPIKPRNGVVQTPERAITSPQAEAAKIKAFYRYFALQNKNE